MFETLTERLGTVLDGLTRRGTLKEADVKAALREVRVALLEADVALDAVKDFVAKVEADAVGENVLRSVTPGQMVVKIVHDKLVEMLGSGESGLTLSANPPSAILMVGLQGSGKTTTSAKIGLKLKKDRQKVLLASLDIYRPAAQQQLATLGEQTDVQTLPVIFGEKPVAIAKRAMDMGRREGFDVVVLDTAGRLHIDDDMMAEVAAVRDVAKPSETLLVADAMTGQDAVTMAREFNERIGVTGLVLTRADGDARGGAALSMRWVTGRPVKFLGVGEKMDALEAFDAGRIAGRILGQGDIVGLVEKAQEMVEAEDAEKMAKKMARGEFSLQDMADQLGQLRKMGDVKGLLGMIPGIGKVKKQLDAANVDDKMIARQQAIILSMTPKERRNPKLINGSRRKRIAAGSGTQVSEVNRVLKQFQQTAKMMKKMGKMGGLPGGLPGGMAPGGLPPGLGPPFR